jgi:hypothetical protein
MGSKTEKRCTSRLGFLDPRLHLLLWSNSEYGIHHWAKFQMVIVEVPSYHFGQSPKSQQHLSEPIPHNWFEYILWLDWCMWWYSRITVSGCETETDEQDDGQENVWDVIPLPRDSLANATKGSPTVIRLELPPPFWMSQVVPGNTYKNQIDILLKGVMSQVLVPSKDLGVAAPSELR